MERAADKVSLLQQQQKANAVLMQILKPVLHLALKKTEKHMSECPTTRSDLSHCRTTQFGRETPEKN